MKVTFLGTNGWYSTRTGNTICTLIEAKKQNILLDAGDGIHRLSAVAPGKRPYAMLLGHLHLDHIIGLHSLPRLKKCISLLDIFLPKDKATMLRQFWKQPFMTAPNDLPFPVRIRGLSDGTHQLPFRVDCLPLVHMGGAFGYRMDIDGKQVVYCSDTGEAPEVVSLAKNADLLIHECSVPGRFEGAWGHVGPVQAAQVAKRANVKRLALTHFSGNDFLSIQQRNEALQKAKKIFSNTITAHDGKSIIV